MKPSGWRKRILNSTRGQILQLLRKGEQTVNDLAAALQLTDNAGASDDHRALNYLAMRYPAIYTIVADAYGRNASLTGVEVRPSPLSGTRSVVDVIFTFTNRNTDVDEKFFVRVDVTEEFPFLVTKLSPYYDH